MSKINILVSACLLGDNVKYNGKNNLIPNLDDKLKDFNIIKVCPEILANLGCPRDPIEIKSNKVITSNNIDVTPNINLAISKILNLVKINNIKYAVLKESSPTCGVNTIYDGNFSHTKIKGSGMLTRTLIKNNVLVFNEFQIDELLIKLRHLK